MIQPSIERQTFNGHVFTRNLNAKTLSDRRYFKRKSYSKGKYRKEILHRVVWSSTNGPIPCDYVIHHIDKDTSNNNISNLECRHKSRSG